MNTARRGGRRLIRQPRRGDTLAAVVEDYIQHFRSEARAERIYFRRLPTLKAAVRLAELAAHLNGTRLTRFPHQRRISSVVLRHSSKALLAALPRIAECRDFESLHELVRNTAGRVRGIGVLTIYDRANRIGGKLGLEPTLVYLHAGTSEGARAIGLSTKNGTAEMSVLPKEFRRLVPREVEDALCIFKRRLRAMNGPRAWRVR